MFFVKNVYEWDKLSWKDILWCENYWLSGKEKVPGTTVNKENDVDRLLGQERIHPYWFP